MAFTQFLCGPKWNRNCRAYSRTSKFEAFVNDEKKIHYYFFLRGISTTWTSSICFLLDVGWRGVVVWSTYVSYSDIEADTQPHFICFPHCVLRVFGCWCVCGRNVSMQALNEYVVDFIIRIGSRVRWKSIRNNGNEDCVAIYCCGWCERSASKHFPHRTWADSVGQWQICKLNVIQFTFCSLVSLENCGVMIRVAKRNTSASPQKPHATPNERVWVKHSAYKFNWTTLTIKATGKRRFDINVIYRVKCSACFPTYSQPICLFFWIFFFCFFFVPLPSTFFFFICFTCEHFRFFVVERPIKI